jgi:CheY-like chemotaxis protein
MNRDVEARAFEPFFTTKGERGSGLGLAVVFRIAERHGGRMSISSSPGSGTTVTMELPARQLRDAGGGGPEHVDDPSSLHVLLVDDDPVFSQAAAFLMQREGHVVATAASGEEALAHLARQPVDVVVSDVVMGTGMNGWELARLVRDRWPTVRVVISSGLAAAVDAAEATARGVDAVLAKPYRVADIRRALGA